MGKILCLILFSLASCAYAQTDRQIIACTILGEARGEGAEGMAAVAQVILNRTSERRLTAAQVCLQPAQFSFWNTPRRESYCLNLLGTKEGRTALELAARIMEGKTVCRRIKNATFYHTLNSAPRWSRKMRVVDIINNHIFYING